jgi:predicted nuclease of predicted toxin-antitoxin system
VRLLLDEMYPGAITTALRDRGHDVVAVQDVPSLREMKDVTLFQYAQAERRALLTENVRDFIPLDSTMHEGGIAHHGLIFTSNRAFPRHRDRFIGHVVAALDTYLIQHGDDNPASIVHWL